MLIDNITCRVINLLNSPIVFLPMQLFSQGQWWSIRSTQTLQTEQCFDLAGLINWQVLQIQFGLKTIS